MYHGAFDKELIDYLLLFFKNRSINLFPVKSDIVGNNVYQIRFENKHFALQLLYEAADDAYEAQIRITNIVINNPLKGVGLSRDILNSLYDYCKAHGDMSLWLCEVVNRGWCDYLVEHGASLIREETVFAGSVLLIQNKICTA